MRYRERLVPTPEKIFTGISDFAYPADSDNFVYPTDKYFYCWTRPWYSAERCWDELHPGPPWKSGGPFDKWDVLDGGLVLQNHGTYRGWKYRYRGGFVCSRTPTSLMTLSNMSQVGGTGNTDGIGDISSYGPGAWEKYRPAQPTADLAVFLGEIKDLPRMLSTTAKGFHQLWKSMGGRHGSFGPKSVANHWLNTQFGWLPFISDLRKFYQTYRTLDKNINQIIRDNGQWIKRSGTIRKVVENETIEESDNTSHSPLLVSYHYPDTSHSGTTKVQLTTSLDVWFRGRFRYYIPNVGSVKWRRKAVRLLYGGNISPSLLWELTPWSWLIDWFSNVGDVIANMDNGLAENLAAKYAYVMGTTSHEYTVSSTHQIYGGPLTATWSYPIVRKQRCPAHQFGFGLTDNDLTIRQWSILSALGLSRLR